jgi:hypothetical protein
MLFKKSQLKRKQRQTENLRKGQREERRHKKRSRTISPSNSKHD